jgi:hypothetical protein
MRSRTLVIIGVVAILIVLGLPMIGYASLKESAASVNIDVTARCASATSFNAASYTCSFAVDQGGKPSYWSYVGTFWGSLGHTGSVVINYPAVSIVILNMVTGDRIVEDQYFDYTWGQVWSHSFKVDANAGQRVHVQVEIYAAQGMSMGYKTFDYTVPSL